MLTNEKKGFLITFEGIEGSGKSTHCKHAAEYVRKKGYNVLAIREPGGTTIGEEIRRILLDKNNKEMSVEGELLLYNAARVQLVKEVIAPAIGQGTIIMCDRYTDSTLAYQCYGGKLDEEVVRVVNSIASCHIVPRITFLFDSDVDRGLKRAAERSGKHDRMEEKSIRFHQRVRDGFLTLARKEPERLFIVDEMTIDEGKKIIEGKLDEIFG